MSHLPSLEDKPLEELDRILHGAVEKGDVRVLLNDLTVPKEHIAIYLRLHALAFPESPKVLPPDVELSYDDLMAVFDRPTIDNRKRGRPRKEDRATDRRLTFEMHKMLASHPQRASSAAEAARILVKSGQVPGAGTSESRAKRLVRAFRRYYSS